MASGAYDCITAKVIEQAGFPGLYDGGRNVCKSFRVSDYCLLTMSEKVYNAGNSSSSVNVPLIADADKGAETNGT